MNEFIQTVVQRLGASETGALTATGGVLQWIRDRVGEGEFSGLMDKLPGAEQALAAAPAVEPAGAEASSSGGRLGGWLRSAVGMLRGGSLPAPGILGTLQQSGLDLSQAAGFGTLFVDYLREKAGPETVNRILGKLPELQKLVK